jgi:hypothetical protein
MVRTVARSCAVAALAPALGAVAARRADSPAAVLRCPAVRPDTFPEPIRWEDIPWGGGRRGTEPLLRARGLHPVRTSGFVVVEHEGRWLARPVRAVAYYGLRQQPPGAYNIADAEDGRLEMLRIRLAVPRDSMLVVYRAVRDSLRARHGRPMLDDPEVDGDPGVLTARTRVALGRGHFGMVSLRADSLLRGRLEVIYNVPAGLDEASRDSARAEWDLWRRCHVAETPNGTP